MSGFPEVEGAMRTYLRSLLAVTSLVSTRVFFGIPANTTYPLITISQIAGAPDASASPIYESTLSFDCWGLSASETGSKLSATAIKSVVEKVIDDLNCTELNSSVTALWGNVVSTNWMPDPDTNRARYTITAVIAAIQKES